MKLFSVFLIHILLYEKSITIWYLVTTIWVFEYYSEITNGPNTNSTIWSKLFEYQIIQMIRCNSAQEYEMLKTFFSKFNIKTTWIYCNQTPGVFNYTTGNWTGAVGQVEILTKKTSIKENSKMNDIGHLFFRPPTLWTK